MKERNKEVTDLLFELYGVDVSGLDDSFLENSIQFRKTELKCFSNAEYLGLIKSSSEGDTLIHSLRISYSEFFRNPLTFAVLERLVFPSLIMQKRSKKHSELRIWSAACASGQEVYSVAIILEQLKNNDENKFNYRIFATDQSEIQLKKAAAGQYSLSDLNGLTLKNIGDWFDRSGDIYLIKPQLKKNVDFSVFNLLNKYLSSPPDSIFGDFDMVVCANLLFYYKKEYQKIILEKIAGGLKEGGYIVTGETERDILIKLDYTEVYPQSAIFQKRFRKN